MQKAEISSDRIAEIMSILEKQDQRVVSAVRATIEAIDNDEHEVGFEGWFAMQPRVLTFLEALGYPAESFHYHNMVNYPALWWD